jgi:CheY-like chemotaxis protein
MSTSPQTTPAMTAKRALIVDDSRSARVILGRILQDHGLGVDSSESAEHALELLRHQRPDVIFMDHLMPGMDGLQAVQAIKSNPATAMIPVIMYTSQEGDLYVSQARALGAVGVLPKTVKQTDVARVLAQLNLLVDQSRDEDVSELLTPAQAASGGPPPTVVRKSPPSVPLDFAADTAFRTALTGALKEQSSELRRFVLASLEAFARRIGADLKGASDPQATPPPAAVAIETTPVAKPPALPPNWILAAVALIALLPSIILGGMYSQVMTRLDAVTAKNAQLSASLAARQVELAAASANRARARTAAPAAAPAASLASAMFAVDSEPVAYGELPFAGNRLDRLRELLPELRARGFRGTLRAVSYIGDFCLSNTPEGYVQAEADVSVKRCDVIGNPFADNLTPAQQQSLGFANLISTVRRESGGKIRIEVAVAGRRPEVAYPSKSDQLMAPDWNKIAALNNRVEFIVEPTT